MEQQTEDEIQSLPVEIDETEISSDGMVTMFYNQDLEITDELNKTKRFLMGTSSKEE